MGKPIGVLMVVPALCGIAALSLWRMGDLSHGAAAIGLDNTLSDRIMMSSVPYLLGGLALGVLFCCTVGRERFTTKIVRVWSVLLGLLACVLLTACVSWDISIAGFINGRLSTVPAKWVDQAHVSYMWLPTAGALVFGLSFLSVAAPRLSRRWLPLTS